MYNLKKIKFGFLFLFIGSLVLLSFNSKEDGLGLSESGKMLYGRVALFGKRIEEKYQMHPCSVGGGSDEGKIRLMSQDFQRYGPPLTENEARKLIIDCLHDYMSYANNDEELRPFLKTFPLTPKNINLTIYIFTENGERPFDPYIANVSFDNGEIYYTTKGEHQEYGFKSEKYEKYEEAIEILGKE